MGSNLLGTCPFQVSMESAKKNPEVPHILHWQADDFHHPLGRPSKYDMREMCMCWRDKLQGLEIEKKSDNLSASSLK